MAAADALAALRSRADAFMRQEHAAGQEASFLVSPAAALTLCLPDRWLAQAAASSRASLRLSWTAID